MICGASHLLLLLLACVATAAEVVPYTLTQPGNVSAAVYDADGRLVRELLHAVPQQPGTHSFVWDGLDRDGNSLPAGDYTWKLLQTPGLKATYLMSLGSNYPPGDAWNTACGPGTHHSPFGVAVDETGTYVAAHTTENIETCMLKMSPDGASRLWTALHPRPWDGALSLATDGGKLFMLGHTAWSDPRIKVKLSKQCVFVYDPATGKLAPQFQADFGTGPQPNGIEVQWDDASKEMDASDMDAHAGVLVVAYEKQNALRWYDPEKGDQLDTAEISAPAGIAVGADGTVFVSTGDRIVKLSRSNKTPTDFVTGLDKPGRLDVDHASGDVLVYESGTQQIKRFSAAGVLRTTYGAKGGRQDGLYDDAAKRSFAGFADLCTDGKGGFYVTEATAAPRRTAHFAADGAVVREWYGGQRWAPHATPEGDDPGVMWVGSQYGTVMRVLVDYDRKSWAVHSCYRYTGLADGLVGDSWNEAGYFRVSKHGGDTYLALENLPTILKVDEKNWKLVPATVCGNVGHAPAFLKEWAGKHGSYQWNDADGDGRPQQAEVTFYDDGGIASGFMPFTAADFTCYTATGQYIGSRCVNRFPVTSWNDVGSPIYGTMPRGERFATMPQRFDPGHFADPRWAVFMGQDPKSGAFSAAINDWTTGWCSSADSFLQQWSATGQPRWTVDQIRHNLRGIAGTAHDCVVAIDVNGGWNMANLAVTYVWDQDGLYVGGLMDAPHLDGIAKHWYQLGGEFCHASVAMLPDGDVLFFGNWENEMRVYRVSGWKGWQRQSCLIHLAKPAAAHTGQGLTAVAFKDAAMTTPRKVVVTPGIDFSWSEKKPAPAVIQWTGTLLPAYGPAYTGPWSEQADKDAFDGAARGSRDNNAGVVFRFRGTSIRVVGKTGPNGGFADIALDGEPQPQFDAYSPEVKRDVVLFEKDGLPAGDHEVSVTVVGWYGKPRNKASSDSWVHVDKFVVDGKDFDDAGLPHTFTASADGTLALLVNRAAVLEQKEAKPSREEIAGKPVKLPRRRIPISLTHTDGHEGGGIRLEWSTPLTPRQPIPTQSLFP
ncbi:MAG: FlgD immunoglobulin-like domain containing protein [Planctomycetia bacterium]